MDAFIIEELRKNKFFNNIDFDSLLLTNLEGNSCTLSHGELLYRQGEKNNSIFLVINGEINSIPSQFNSMNNSIIFGDNDFFGVNEFISGLPRSESAIAIRDSYLVELPKTTVDKLIKQSDQILTNIYSANEQSSLNFSQTFGINETKTEPSDELETGQVEDIVASEDVASERPIEEKELKIEEIKETDKVNEFDSKIVNEDDTNSKHTQMTFEQLDRINKAAHLVNSNVKIDDVLRNIVDVSVSLCSADRGTLYLVDKSKNELWSKVLQGNEPRRITLKIGDGFAGWAAKNKNIVNVKDASQDERFNDAFDKSSGYTTKSVMCFPIKNKNDDVVGVIQLLNSKNGEFSKLDENFLYALSTNAALALQNADLVEQLLKTERISSLGKMANFLIEDIKKPILVSKRYAEHLKKKELSEDVLNVVNMLLEQLNSIADLVQSTSNYSEGKSVLQSNDSSLNEILNGFIEKIDSYVSAMNCKIIANFSEDCRVNVDSKELYQAFKHIIKNSCEAMPEGGDINLTTKLESGKVNLVLKDNGNGIPAGFEEKIFEPFMSYGKKSGTGLGLSVTKKIIEEHNGTISASSEFGIGCTISITLPQV